MPTEDLESTSEQTPAAPTIPTFPPETTVPLQAMPQKETIAAGGIDSEAVAAPRRLAYVSAFQYAFDNPNWLVSFVLLVIIGFLPVLGHVAQWGFYYEIVEALRRRPNAPYPKFELNRFGDYCMRGVWPYVLSMTVGMILYLIFYLPMQLSLQFGFMFLLASNQQIAIVVAAVVISLVLVGIMFIAVLTAVLTTPLLLRGGLTQDFRQVFRMDWYKGYLRRVWAEETLATLFLMAAGVALMPLGCLAFGVGIFVVPVIVWIAASHMQWQIYEIYLERGGEPIPLHPLPAEAPPVQV